MKYCKKCIQPDTRPNTKFSHEGICPACTYFDELKNVNWQERYEILQAEIEQYRSQPNQMFDCIIGVSGGKDSTRQALWVRDKLKLKPLLVSLSYPPEQITNRGTDNISNLIELGFDVIISAPAPGTWRNLMKESFIKFTNWAKSTELALFSSVPQLAIKYKIPLILWGENPGLQLGDMKTLGKSGFDGNNLRHQNTLSGASPTWMTDVVTSKHKLIPYTYPSEQEFIDSNIQIIYLGWFLGDWSHKNNSAYSVLSGLDIRGDGELDSVENTGDLHRSTSLDENWVTLNQLIKYYKFGFGRVTDYLSEDIRLGKLDRADAIKLVQKYDSSCSNEFISTFTDYIGITAEKFWEIIHKSLNRDLFAIDHNGLITPKFTVGVGL